MRYICFHKHSQTNCAPQKGWHTGTATDLKGRGLRGSRFNGRIFGDSRVDELGQLLGLVLLLGLLAWRDYWCHGSEINEINVLWNGINGTIICKWLPSALKWTMVPNGISIVTYYRNMDNNLTCNDGCETSRFHNSGNASEEFYLGIPDTQGGTTWMANRPSMDIMECCATSQTKLELTGPADFIWALTWDQSELWAVLFLLFHLIVVDLGQCQKDVQPNPWYWQVPWNARQKKQGQNVKFPLPNSCIFQMRV